MKKSIMLFSVFAFLSSGAMADDAADLSAQLGINKAHERQSREAIIAAGGCNADIQPVWVHTACGHNPFGKATEGGGDGSGSGSGDGGSDAK